MPTTVEVVVWIILAFANPTGQMTELSYKFADRDHCMTTLAALAEVTPNTSRLVCVPITEATVTFTCPMTVEPAPTKPLLKPDVGSPA